jgi:hypothetical protein
VGAASAAILSGLKALLLNQRGTAAEHGRAGRLHDRRRAIRSAAAAAGRELADERFELRTDVGVIGLARETRADDVRQQRIDDERALRRRVESLRGGRIEVEARKVGRTWGCW